MVEDTALCFNALKGLPGPYIKWFLEAVHHDGLNRMLHGFDDKTAYALCVFSYTDGPGLPVHTFTGRTDGKIVVARGNAGFGWDAIFEPTEGGGKTYGEMTKEEKNSISHRYRALDKLRAFLKLRNVSGDSTKTD
jgi:inosine triphosphate pyrophosphatase